MTVNDIGATSFELPRELRNDVPSARRGRISESFSEEDFDVGLGWPNRDEWSRTYVDSGRFFRTRVD